MEGWLFWWENECTDEGWLHGWQDAKWILDKQSEGEKLDGWILDRWELTEWTEVSEMSVQALDRY